MEAFEQFVAIAMEAEELVVSSALKFPAKRRTGKLAYEEWQTHGYEVDLVGARSDRLVLASVKSYFGSRGVAAEHVLGLSGSTHWYLLLNDPDIRDGVALGAAERFGYRLDQVELRLYVGKFANDAHEARIRSWAAEQRVGCEAIQVIAATEVVQRVREVAEHKQYRDSAVLDTLKVLRSTGALPPVSTP